MTILFYILLFLFLLLCALLCFVVLIQEAKSLGLGASFGGDTGDSLFGTSTAEVLKKFTAYVAGIFLFASLILSVWSGAIAQPKTPTGIPEEAPEMPMRTPENPPGT